MAARFRARRLLMRHVWLRDSVLRGASLSPFFDDDGKTVALMLVWTVSPKIVLLPYDHTLVRPSVIGRVRLRIKSEDLEDSTEAAAERLRGTWHFDPLWLLEAERYADHPAVPALKSTNLVGYRAAASWVDMAFTRDLSTVIELTAPPPTVDAARTWQAFDPDLLARVQSAREGQKAGRSGWRLAPFWQQPERRSG